MNSRIFRMTMLGIKQFKDPYYQGSAAQMAFYIMLSIVPTILVLTQIFGLIDVPLNFLEEWVNNYVTPSMAKPLSELIRLDSDQSMATTNIAMVVMALWAASRAQFSMMRIANYTFTGGRTTGSYFKERFRAMKTMAFTLFTFAFVAVIAVYGRIILNGIFLNIFKGSFIELLWKYLRWPAAGSLYFLMVSYNYYVLPNEKLTFRQILPGSIFGAVGMLVVTIFYSIYANYASNYDIIYGSLANFVALMFWFYFLSWALCLGLVFNKVWHETNVPAVE